MPRLANKKQCTGCTACYSTCKKKCIIMQPDSYGFVYPKIDSKKCIECKQCESVCPVLHFEKSRLSSNSTIYAAYSKDETVRLKSSSGGIVTEIAKIILNRGGLVIGAAYTDDFSVNHICISSVNNLSSLRGAKYTQSNLNNIFHDIRTLLENNNELLFIGTPCQVAGLKAFLKKSYEKLITIDFICHGVPSPMAWKSYVYYRAEKDNCGEYPYHINLRSKHTGWSHYQYSNLYEYKNGKKYSAKSGDDLFMKLFVGNYINRESCSNCHFKGIERVSDFTVGDFWGIWDIMPEFDDNKGTSIVAVHTEIARSIIFLLSERINLKRVDRRSAYKQNPSMFYSSLPNNKRFEILELISQGNFNQIEEIIKKRKKYSIISYIKRIIKSIIVTKSIFKK